MERGGGCQSGERRDCEDGRDDGEGEVVHHGGRSKSNCEGELNV